MIISAKKNPDQAQTSNRILIGTEIKGDIVSNGDFRIDGKLYGNITLDGKLVVGENGVVEGNISCKNVTIAGVFKGKSNVSELTEFVATAKVKGDIYTEKLSVEAGADFTGTCTMGSGVLQMSDENRSKAKTA